MMPSLRRMLHRGAILKWDGWMGRIGNPNLGWDVNRAGVRSNIWKIKAVNFRQIFAHLAFEYIDEQLILSNPFC